MSTSRNHVNHATWNAISYLRASSDFPREITDFAPGGELFDFPFVQVSRDIDLYVWVDEFSSLESALLDPTFSRGRPIAIVDLTKPPNDAVTWIDVECRGRAAQPLELTTLLENPNTAP